jgi:hypothetical protein
MPSLSQNIERLDGFMHIEERDFNPEAAEKMQVRTYELNHSSRLEVCLSLL